MSLLFLKIFSVYAVSLSKFYLYIQTLQSERNIFVSTSVKRKKCISRLIPGNSLGSSSDKIPIGGDGEIF